MLPALPDRLLPPLSETETAPVGQRIGDEVDRQAFVRFCRHAHRHSWPRRLLAPLGADLKAFLRVDPIGARSRGGRWCSALLSESWRGDLPNWRVDGLGLCRVRFAVLAEGFAAGWTVGVDAAVDEAADTIKETAREIDEALDDLIDPDEFPGEDV